MTFRYIGSKARIAAAIACHIGAPRSGQRFVDLFCGTGAVAAQAARLGWGVILNDHLRSAVTMAAARLTSQDAAKFRSLGGYAGAIERLNQLPPERGFIWREYTPATSDRLGFERRYFTEENGGRIDSIRKQIRCWAEDGSIDHVEERLLIADLVAAANRVANIAGTYGCFMARWQPNALSDLVLRTRELLADAIDVEVRVQDAFAVQTLPSDVVYLDPPYTKRQYAAYYHLTETITIGDEPVIEGITGLRPWRSMASEFCYKGKALEAFLRLTQGLAAERILISYSDEGHVPLDALASAIGRTARVKISKLDGIARYRPNRVASAGRREVHEHLLEVTPAAALAAA